MRSSGLSPSRATAEHATCKTTTTTALPPASSTPRRRTKGPAQQTSLHTRCRPAGSSSSKCAFSQSWKPAQRWFVECFDGGSNWYPQRTSQQPTSATSTAVRCRSETTRFGPPPLMSCRRARDATQTCSSRTERCPRKRSEACSALVQQETARRPTAMLQSLLEAALLKSLPLRKIPAELAFSLAGVGFPR